jgi:hypothetical protein
MALTDTRLRTLKPGKGKSERLVADGNGLYLRLRAARCTFTRTWQFRRKVKGRPSITTLGTYPELSIKEARLKAAELATKPLRPTSSQTPRNPTHPTTNIRRPQRFHFVSCLMSGSGHRPRQIICGKHFRVAQAKSGTGHCLLSRAARREKGRSVDHR